MPTTCWPRSRRGEKQSSGSKRTAILRTSLASDTLVIRSGPTIVRSSSLLACSRLCHHIAVVAMPTSCGRNPRLHAAHCGTAGLHPTTRRRAGPAQACCRLEPIPPVNFGPGGKLNRRFEMVSKTKIALSVAIVLNTAFPASAATRHHRVTKIHPEIYNTVPDAISGSCSPFHAPLCSNICAGPVPCAPLRNY